MAWSSTTAPGNGLLLHFFTNRDGSTLLVQPANVDMGPFNVPDAGTGWYNVSTGPATVTYTLSAV